MARERRKPTATTTVPETEPVPTQAKRALVAVRLKADAPVGRLVVGNVVVERTKPAVGWPLVPAVDYERLASEYGLEVVE